MYLDLKKRFFSHFSNIPSSRPNVDRSETLQLTCLTLCCNRHLGSTKTEKWLLLLLVHVVQKCHAERCCLAPTASHRATQLSQRASSASFSTPRDLFFQEMDGRATAKNRRAHARGEIFCWNTFKLALKSPADAAIFWSYIRSLKLRPMRVFWPLGKYLIII